MRVLSIVVAICDAQETRGRILTGVFVLITHRFTRISSE